MSIIKAFVDAFRKASTPKEPNALEHARADGLLGPTTDGAAGTFEPIKPGAVPPGQSSVPSIDHVQNPRDVGPINRPPSDPRPPNEPGDQGPIDGGGGDGGTPTPPQAPFNPVGVVFPTRAAAGGSTSGDIRVDDGPRVESHLEDGGTSGSEGPFRPRGDEEFKLKIEDVRVTPVGEPGVPGDDAISQPEDGPGPVGFKFPPKTAFEGGIESVDLRAGSIGGDDDASHAFMFPPKASFDSGGIAEDPDAAGEVVELRRPPAGIKMEELPVAPIDDGGEIVELRRPPAGIKMEELPVAPIDDGGEIVELRRPPTGFKIEELPVAPIDDGGEVVELRRPPTGFKVEELPVAPIVQGADQPSSGRPYIGETEKDLRAIPSAREGDGKAGEEFFKLKIEELHTPAAPGGVPIPYPLEDGPADANGPGAGDWIARKAGKGQQEFLEAKVSESFMGRVSLGEDELPDDDDFESSSLLDLKPQPVAGEMLPGLAGELPGDDEFDFELDDDSDDSDDTDESEL